ncbi:hypothetical protein ElyMa_003444200 [Elysia marginata]|uniref:RBPJ-interacting and tubulin-associated protein n=1 Tax=Elysia marginata TaxID=1093978 RepID=A0AAV4JW10_9GAST|nr:hypothetical protein ElyMa_003444200 [Elysia marginata]
MFFNSKSTSGAPHPPPSPTRGRRSPAPWLLRQGYPEEEDPSPDRTSRLDSMGHTALPSTIDKVRPKWYIDGRPTKFPQANSPQPPGSPPCRSRSHLTANKVLNSRDRSRFRGIEESDRTTEVRQEDGKKSKQE